MTITLPLDKESAILAGEIELNLKEKGIVIELEDIMIAAISIQNNEALITKNLKHFESYFCDKRKIPLCFP